jgi:histone deacetylase 8
MNVVMCRHFCNILFCQFRMKRVGYIYSPTLQKYSDLLPQSKSRSLMLHSLIFAYGLQDSMEIVAPVRATREDLETFHTTEYIDRIYSNQDDSDSDEYGLA